MLMEKENITPEYVQQVDVEPDFWQFPIGPDCQHRLCIVQHGSANLALCELGH